MFKVDFMVEDKYVAAVLHSLPQFKVLNMTCLPVTNVAVKGGKVTQAEPGTKIIDRLAAKLANFAPGSTISMADFKALVTEAGSTSTTGFGSYIVALKERDILRSVKNRRGHYHIVAQKGD